MTKKYLLIDLFAGLGGASQAFAYHPHWEVLCIENNPELIPHLDDDDRTYHFGDVTDLLWVKKVIVEHVVDEPTREKIVVWASPPCDQWSNGYNSLKSQSLRGEILWSPDFACLDATWEIIKWLSNYCLHENIEFTYCIENVRGGIEYISDRLGFRWRQQVGQMFLWGNFPIMTISPELAKHKKPDKRHSPIRPNIRAKVPFEASQAFRLAITNQRRFF